MKLKPLTSYDFSKADLEFVLELAKVGHVHLWFVDWKCLSLGVHLNLTPLHIEIHLPFGFLKIGMVYKRHKAINEDDIKWRGFGFTERHLI